MRHTVNTIKKLYNVLEDKKRSLKRGAGKRGQELDRVIRAGFTGKVTFDKDLKEVGT